MKTIWKYEIPVTDVVELSMPKDAHILPKVAAVAPNRLNVWAVVDPANELEIRQFLVVGTGNPLPEEASIWIGTVVTGPFVWHLFEPPKKRQVALDES